MNYIAPPEHQEETLMKGSPRTDGKMWFQYNFSTLFCGYGKIYTLSDKSGNVFYVGCTVQDIETRVGGHICEAKGNHAWNRDNAKLVRIRELNYEVVITVIDMRYVTAVDGKEATRKLSELEKSWMRKYMDLGYSLTNREALKKNKEIKIKKPEFIGQSFTTPVIKS